MEEALEVQYLMKTLRLCEGILLALQKVLRQIYLGSIHMVHREGRTTAMEKAQIIGEGAQQQTMMNSPVYNYRGEILRDKYIGGQSSKKQKSGRR
jgi:hypothetical protein